MRRSMPWSWQHQLRKTDLLSANYQYSEVKFDEFTEELRGLGPLAWRQLIAAEA